MRKSPVWKFYERILEDGLEGRCVAVECKLCARTFKFFGNTTNLKVHLTSRHPIQWELSENGTLDDTAAIQFEDESNILLELPKHKYKNILEKSDTDQHEDDDGVDIVQQLTNNEEWLEDNHFPEVEHENPRKRKLKVVKREIDSPPRQLKYLFAKKPNQSMTVLQPAPSKIEPRKDEYDVFGEYIASKLRKIAVSRTRGNVQQLITTILWQAEYGKYDDSESVKRIIQFTNEDLHLHSHELETEALQNCENQSIEDNIIE